MPTSRLDWLLGAVLPSLRCDPRPDAELLGASSKSVMRQPSRHCCCGTRRACAPPAAAGYVPRRTSTTPPRQRFSSWFSEPRSIRDRAALGRWLYGVADRVARRLRQQQGRVRSLPEDLAGPEPMADVGLRDLLAEEMARLPEKYRLPVQLCYAAGLSTAQAAERLGWPKGTVLDAPGLGTAAPAKKPQPTWRGAGSIRRRMGNRGGAGSQRLLGARHRARGTGHAGGRMAGHGGNFESDDLFIQWSGTCHVL